MSKIKLIFALMFCIVSLSFAQEELPKSATTTWIPPLPDKPNNPNSLPPTIKAEPINPFKISFKDVADAGVRMQNKKGTTEASLTDRLLKGCTACSNSDYTNLNYGGKFLPNANGPLLDPNDGPEKTK